MSDDVITRPWTGYRESGEIAAQFFGKTSTKAGRRCLACDALLGPPVFAQMVHSRPRMRICESSTLSASVASHIAADTRELHPDVGELNHLLLTYSGPRARCPACIASSPGTTRRRACDSGFDVGAVNGWPCTVSGPPMPAHGRLRHVCWVALTLSVGPLMQCPQFSTPPS